VAVEGGDDDIERLVRGQTGSVSIKRERVASSKRRPRASPQVRFCASAALRFLHVFANEGDELLRAETLVALHVADNADLARRRAAGERFDNEL